MAAPTFIIVAITSKKTPKVTGAKNKDTIARTREQSIKTLVPLPTSKKRLARLARNAKRENMIAGWLGS